MKVKALEKPLTALTRPNRWAASSTPEMEVEMRTTGIVRARR